MAPLGSNPIGKSYDSSTSYAVGLSPPTADRKQKQFRKMRRRGREERGRRKGDIVAFLLPFVSLCAINIGCPGRQKGLIGRTECCVSWRTTESELRGN